MKITTKQITYTALLLALLIAIQQFKNLSQYITGPAVNAILIVSTLYLGLFSGIVLAAVSPVSAFLVNPTPLLIALPLMIPVIITGNIIIVLFAHFFKNKNLMSWLTIGSLVKAFFLWGAVSILIKFIAPDLNAQMVTALKTMFSVNQAITAITGSIAAFFIWRGLNL